MLQISRLEGFYWVARTEGYARAARAFPYPITQPAVHQQVKKLERELGVSLFERVGKNRMAMTPAGRRLYEFICPFFEGLPGLARSLQAGDYGGEFAIHTSGVVLRGLLPSWIQRLQKRRPGISIQLHEQPTPTVEGLLRGEAEVVVDHLPTIPDSVSVMQVATMYPFVVLPRSHRAAQHKRFTLTSLAADTFIANNPGTHAHSLQHAALARQGLTPPRTLSASSMASILGFVEAGLGWSLVASLDPKGPRDRGVAVRPLAAKVQFPVYAAWRRDAPDNPLLDAFLEAAPEH